MHSKYNIQADKSKQRYEDKDIIVAIDNKFWLNFRYQWQL